MSNRFIAIMLVIVLAFSVAACAPAATPANEASVSVSNAQSDAAVFVAPRTITPNTYVNDYMSSGADHILIDVREPHEFNDGHIEGAINIPLAQIPNRLSEIPQDTQVILYCRSGNRSNQAAAILAGAGYSGLLDLGGVIAWTQAGHPLQ